MFTLHGPGIGTYDQESFPGTAIEESVRKVRQKKKKVVFVFKTSCVSNPVWHLTSVQLFKHVIDTERMRGGRERERKKEIWAGVLCTAQQHQPQLPTDVSSRCQHIVWGVAPCSLWEEKQGEDWDSDEACWGRQWPGLACCCLGAVISVSK